MRRIWCSFKKPHSTHSETNIGSLSMMFSYGRFVGYSYAGVTSIAQDVTSTTQRHINKWRSHKTHVRVPRHELTSALLVSLQAETTQLLMLAQGATMKNGTNPLLAGDAADDALDREIEALDDTVEDDDDDDFDDFDEDDDDDDDDGDEEDDYLEDDDDTVDEPPPPLRQDQF